MNGSPVKESSVSDEAGSREHSALCLRLLQLFPRVSRGMRRWQDQIAPSSSAPLGPRHVAALQQLRGGAVTVGELASRLGLTLPTVSGVLADLDRGGFIERHADPADRRRTIVAVIPARAALVAERTGRLAQRQAARLYLSAEQGTESDCHHRGHHDHDA